MLICLKPENKYIYIFSHRLNDLDGQLTILQFKMVPLNLQETVSCPSWGLILAFEYSAIYVVSVQPGWFHCCLAGYPQAGRISQFRGSSFDTGCVRATVRVHSSWFAHCTVTLAWPGPITPAVHAQQICGYVLIITRSSQVYFSMEICTLNGEK